MSGRLQQLREMGRYEECLAEAQRAYRSVSGARGAERERAEREYERVLARAREMAMRLRAATAPG